MRQRRKRRADANPGRLTFIEGMRGLAALYVVLCHFCSMADPRAFQGETSHAPLWLQRVMAPFWYGHLAVAAFIVISGFCLQMSLFGKGSGKIRSLPRFFGRRARRILPPYYACLAFSIFVALTVTVTQTGMPFEQYLPVDSRAIWSHLLLIHNLSPQEMYRINGVLWSIAAEAQLYLLFPLLVLMVAKFGRNLSLLLTCGAAWAVLDQFPASVKLYPWYLALFTLGIVAAHAAFRPVLQLGVRPGLALFASFVAGAACVGMVWSNRPLYVSDAFAAISCAAFLYAGCVAPARLPARMMGARPLSWLGAISYSLYLMHHPIEQIVYVYRPSWIQGEAPVFGYLLAVGLPIILVGCAAFWLCFERPFVRRARSASGSAPSRRAAVSMAYRMEEARHDMAI